MVSVQSPPRGRELPYLRVLLLPAVVMAAVTGAAVAAVPQPARAAVGWCGAVATALVVAVAAEAARRGRLLRDLRAEHARRTASLEQRLASHDEVIVRLGTELLPAGVLRVRGGESPDEVIRRVVDPDPYWRQLSEAQREFLRAVLRLVEDESTLRDSAQRSFVNVARRIQAIVHQQAKELREMEEDHGRNPEVFDDLLRIDHGNALIGRLVDTVAVLGGGRPGRQWPLPVPLYSVLRGAMSRILEYPRIKLDSIAKVNIRGISVEPVIQACAELLDNATRYSPPTSKVHVTAVEVQTGIAIEIEDAGTGLSQEDRVLVDTMLARARAGADLQELGSNPRLGLAVVGRLCTAHNMQVALRDSAYGGVRAVLVIPSEMITSEPGVGLAHGVGVTAVPEIDTDGVEGPKRRPKRRRPTSPRIPDTPPPLADDIPEITEWTAGGLPQRRSRVRTPLSQRLAQQAAIEREEREKGYSVWSTPKPEPEPEEKDDTPPGAWVGAFFEGLKDYPDITQAATPTAEPTEPVRDGADDERDPT
jgi:signal transduction histidine kinase